MTARDRRTRGARAAVSVAFFAHGALFGTWVARIPAVRDDLELGNDELGVALFGATLGGLITLPLAGWVVSRAGSRTTVAEGLPVFAATLPLVALAPSLPVLVMALFAFGAAAGAVDVAMNAHGLAVERLYRTPILSSFHAGWSLGGLAGAAAGAGAAALEIDPLLHFAAIALVLGASGLAASRLLLPAAADRPDTATRFQRPPRRLLPLAVLAFCALFAEAAAADWSAVYIDDPLDAGETVAALGFAAFSIAMTALRLVGDRMTARWGPVALARGGGLAAGGGLALALVVPHPVAALAGFACMGAGLAAIVPIAFRAAGSIPGLPPGAGIAALTTVGYGAFLVAPPVIGFAAEAVGLAVALWIVVALQAGLVLLAPATRLGEA